MKNQKVYSDQYSQKYIKTSGSKSRLRKVELASAHKKCDDYCEYFTHNNETCKKTLQSNLTALIYSLVNGLYKITTESIKLILDAEQSGASSDLIIPTCDVQKVSFFLLLHIPMECVEGILLLLHILIKILDGISVESMECLTFHGMSNIPWIPQKFHQVFFSLHFTIKSKTSIDNSMLFALPAAQVLV